MLEGGWDVDGLGGLAYSDGVEDVAGMALSVFGGGVEAADVGVCSALIEG